MKWFLFVGFVFVLSLSFVSAADCEITATLLNQDPYPAVPGEYVKLVFQIDGLDTTDCGEVTVELVEEFPVSFDPNQTRVVQINSGTFTSDFQSFLIAPYRVRVSEEALEGDNPIELKYTFQPAADGAPTELSREFQLNVQNVKTDFEISVKDYNKATRMLLFEILNVGEHDVEALTVEIPRQHRVEVKGPSRNIVGSLDANEDTTFSFEAIPEDGELELKILYTDETNVRRTITKKVSYDGSYFEGLVRDEQGSSTGRWVVVVLVLVGLFWWWRRRRMRVHGHSHGHKHS
ncbi:hypothetical protein CMI48_00510 [Candidatus Pacearchaeota archaeon]|nr:hypothetical protein [Candidatus Pacearchaeota archaeon]